MGMLIELMRKVPGRWTKCLGHHFVLQRRISHGVARGYASFSDFSARPDLLDPASRQTETLADTEHPSLYGPMRVRRAKET
jgi:hypothetical protein